MSNKDDIRGAMDGAKVINLHGGSSGEEGDNPRPETMIEDNHPVRPLGVLGDVAFYLDGLNQLRPLKFKDHTRLNIQSLFMPNTNLVKELWPKTDKKGTVSGWHPDHGAEELMALAGWKGIFNPSERLRGTGCWRDDAGQLVMHCGDVVIINGEENRPGLIDGYVYPGAEAIAKPVKKLNDPGEDLLKLFKCWKFKREIDAVLLLGWVGAAILSGALDWRPLAWITGDTGMGKSTLQKVVTEVLGRGGVIFTTDATSAGLWQKLGYKSLPVAFDEMEAQEDNRKMQAIVKLAREAASGGTVLRGGQDHQGAEFVARSCFLFSSINTVPLPPQDQSRMAILALDPLPEGAKAPLLDRKKLGWIGTGLRHTFMTRWSEFDETLQVYSDHLASMGHSGRSADVFGTLMACAHILLYDVRPQKDFVEGMCAPLHPDTLLERADTIMDSEACLEHLLLSELDVGHGTRKQVINLLETAVDKYDPACAANDGHLQRCGMRLYTEMNTKAPHYGERFFMVANRHPGLTRLFNETHWQGRPDAMGVWVQALRRCPNSMVLERGMKFAGVTMRGTCIPLSHIFEGYTNDVPMI